LTARTAILRPQERRAIDALLSGASLATVAATASVSERTLRNWRSKPAFAAALKKAQDEVLGDARSELRAATLAAVRALREIVESRRSPEPSRLNAARVILDFAMRDLELQDMADRIEALETRTNEETSRGFRR
jgi:hypothetical protein